ncbi:MAG: hypothetical protein Q9162_002675 [Coniocarpon cinnabarinum]
MSDLNSLCFAKNQPYMLVTGHTNGQLCQWNLIRYKHEQLKPFQQYGLREQDITNVSNGVILQALSDQTVLMSHGEHLWMFDRLAGRTLPTAVEIGDNVLDLRFASVKESVLIVLTAKDVVWVRVRRKADTEEELIQILGACAHHRDAADVSLRLFVSYDNDVDPHGAKNLTSEANVWVYSRKNFMITEIQCQLDKNAQDDHNFQVRIGEPTALSFEPHWQHVKVLQLWAVPIDLRDSAENARALDRAEQNDSVKQSFYQVFWVASDQSLWSCIYCRPHSQAQNAHLDQLSWNKRRNLHPPLSSRFATENFIVDSDEDEIEQQDSQRPISYPWWMKPRLHFHETQREEQVENTLSVRLLSRVLGYSRLSTTESLREKLEDFHRQHKQRNLLNASTHGLLRDTLQSQSTPDDLFEASTPLQTFTSELAVSRHGPRSAAISLVPLLDLAQETVREHTHIQPSLHSLYESVLDCYSTPIPQTYPGVTRLLWERCVRYFTTNINLSSVSIFTQPPSDEEVEAGWQKTVSSLKSHVSINFKRNDTGQRMRSALSVLSSWHEEVSGDSSPTSAIDLTRYDAALIAPQTEEQQSESQRQLRKLEKQKRRAEQASQSMPLSSQLSQGSIDITSQQLIVSSQRSRRPSFGSSHGSPWSSQPSTQAIFGTQGTQSSQRGAVSGFQSSQASSFRSGREAPSMERRRSQLPAAFASSQLLTPPATQSQKQGLSQLSPTAGNTFSVPGMVTAQRPDQRERDPESIVKQNLPIFGIPSSSLKRSSQAMPGSQTSVGLPERKKRKAGF